MTDQRIVATPSQTIGPFFGFGMAWMNATHLVPEASDGAVTLVGRIVDGAGEPVPDALVEIWQADPAGRFPPKSEAGWTGSVADARDFAVVSNLDGSAPEDLVKRPGALTLLTALTSRP